MKLGSTEFGAVGAVFGAKTHTLTESQIPSHHHADLYVDSTKLQWIISFATTGGTGAPSVGPATGSTMRTGFTGGDQSHNNVQPSIALTPLIKV